MLVQNSSGGSDSAYHTVIGEQKLHVNMSNTNQYTLMDTPGAVWTMQRGFLYPLGKICIDTSMYDGTILKL